MAEEDKNKDQAGLMDDLGEGPHYVGYTLVSVIALIIVGVTLIMVFATEKIEPWEVGVRTWDVNYYIAFGKHKGEPDTLNPGYCIKFPYTSIYKFDRSVLRLDLPAPAKAKGGEVEDGVGESGSNSEVIRVRTAQDNLEFDVYITVLYRIDPRKAVDIKKRFETSENIKVNGIKAVLMSRLKNKLGEIGTYTQFFGNADLVRQKVEEARREQNEFYTREEYGIVIDDIMIWDYKFPSSIEASMLGTVIAKKMYDMQIAMSKAAEQKAILERRLAEAEAAYDEELARGRSQAVEIDADAKAYYDEKLSEGEKTVMQAKSEGLGNINSALANRGGTTYVGLEYADVLKGIDLIVLPASGKNGVNPLDLDQTIRQLQPAGGGAAPAEVPR
jgi:regulator of protease activity HflC (stomatin/prohibitin superfamily)